MGYRIHINICTKREWKKYLKKHKKDSDRYPMYSPDIKGICVETFDDFDIKKYEMVDVGDEYNPHITDKKGFREILVKYQDRQLEIIRDFERDYDEIKKNYNDKQEVDDLVFKLLHSAHCDNNNNKMFYYDKLKREDKLILNCDTYSLQYYYLLEQYNKFNDRKNVLVLTHG